MSINNESIGLILGGGFWWSELDHSALKLQRKSVGLRTLLSLEVIKDSTKMMVLLPRAVWGVLNDLIRKNRFGWFTTTLSITLHSGPKPPKALAMFDSTESLIKTWFRRNCTIAVILIPPSTKLVYCIFVYINNQVDKTMYFLPLWKFKLSHSDSLCSKMEQFAKELRRVHWWLLC